MGRSEPVADAVTLAPPPGAAFIRAHATIDPFAAGLEIERAHPHVFGSAQFDARDNANARFSTVHVAGQIAPVFYSGEDRFAAASETIFHTVDGPGGPARPRRVPVAKYLTWQWSTVATTRPITLVRLDGNGLTDLGTTRADLIEGDWTSYGTTRTWATALLAALPDVDGFWWLSRQAPTRKAFALYGHVPGRTGGLTAANLQGIGPALPFALPGGLDELDAIAAAFDITVLRA